MTFQLKPFQVEDLSRAAIHDGCIIAWQQGLGKSLAAIVYPLLKVGVDWPMSRAKHGLYPLKPCLLVAPENLHGQLEQEWKRRFGIHAVRLDCQDTYLALTETGHLPAGWFLSSYTQLGMNKIDRLPIPATCPHEFAEVAQVMHFYGVTMDDVKAHREQGSLLPEDASVLDKALAICGHRFRNCAEGVGDVKNGIKCIFAPSLADLCGHEFACVVIDEGTRIKGENTIIGQAIRELNPPYRLVLTATPVKNRLRDIFWLLHWAAGGSAKPTPRFPYSNDSGQQDQFTAEFNVCERNLSAEARAEQERGTVRISRRRRRSRGSPGVTVCNIHKLWKLIAPLALRKRKQDIAEDIVKCQKHIVRVPLGVEQYEVYRYHLLASYQDKNGKPAYMAKLQALRSAAAAPHSELLRDLDSESSGDTFGRFRSAKPYIPKLAAALTLIEQRLRLGEQTVVFSALHEPLDTLSQRLKEAAIPHDLLDGRTSAARRGSLAAEFRLGLPLAKPVLLAGLKAMGEGNNWPKANNIILLAQDWAYDINAQAPERCWRLDSEKDVNVFPIVCIGSIDRKLEAGYDEKGDAAELVLDGELMAEDRRELSLQELLQVAVEDFRSATTYSETVLEAEWPALRERLSRAWEECQRLTGRTKVNPQKRVPLAALLEKLKEMETA